MITRSRSPSSSRRCRSSAAARRRGVPIVLRQQNVESDLWAAAAALGGRAPALAARRGASASRPGRAARCARSRASLALSAARCASGCASSRAARRAVDSVAPPFPAELPAADEPPAGRAAGRAPGQRRLVPQPRPGALVRARDLAGGARRAPRRRPPPLRRGAGAGRGRGVARRAGRQPRGLRPRRRLRGAAARRLRGAHEDPRGLGARACRWWRRPAAAAASRRATARSCCWPGTAPSSPAPSAGSRARPALRDALVAAGPRGAAGAPRSRGRWPAALGGAAARGCRRAVKILLVTTRYPWPPRRGLELRALQFAEWLAGEHAVTLLAPRAARAPPAAAARSSLSPRDLRPRRGRRRLGPGQRRGRAAGPLQAGLYAAPSTGRRHPRQQAAAAPTS